MLITRFQYHSPEGGDDGSNLPGGRTSDDGSRTTDDKSKEKYVTREAYESFKQDFFKIKDANKALLEENEKFKADQTAREEQSLLDKDKHLEVIESLKGKISELEGSVGERDQRIAEYVNQGVLADKIQAFNEAADFKVDSKYYGHIDLDKIEVDEKGVVNKKSVSSVVDSFKNDHPSLIQTGNKGPKYRHPGTSQGADKISEKEWIRQGAEKGSAWMARNENRVIRT